MYRNVYLLIKKSISRSLLFIIYCSLFIINPSFLYAHGPDQVDHNFYLLINQDKIVLRIEIPIGEILGFVQRQKMDVDKNGIISQEEQDGFLKQFTEEHLKNITITINNQNNMFIYTQSTIDITTYKVIPAAMMVKIFLEYNLTKNTSTNNFNIYIKDEADKNITQFINLYTEGNIQNINIEKELLYGEERIFKLSFTIPESKNIITNNNQAQNTQSKPYKLYNKIKIYLTTKNIPIKISILIFCFAIILGILHALEPGHGKSIMTAYVLATKGAVLDIVLLGIVVVITHTLIVFILGLTTLYLSQYILPQTIYPYLSFISSMLIIFLGLSLIKRNVNTNRTDHNHESIKITNSYLKDIIQFGISGGLVPCPAAIAILLTAIQFNKITTGIILIVALSIGIAVTLISVGIIAIYTKKFVFGNNRHPHTNLQTILPILSGIFITTLGTILLLKIFEEFKIFKITL